MAKKNDESIEDIIDALRSLRTRGKRNNKSKN